MTRLEKVLALLTLVGAIATALAVFVGVTKPKPATTQCVSVTGKIVACAASECTCPIHIGRWWLYHCGD